MDHESHDASEVTNDGDTSLEETPILYPNKGTYTQTIASGVVSSAQAGALPCNPDDGLAPAPLDAFALQRQSLSQLVAMQQQSLIISLHSDTAAVIRGACRKASFCTASSWYGTQIWYWTSWSRPRRHPKLFALELCWLALATLLDATQLGEVRSSRFCSFLRVSGTLRQLNYDRIRWPQSSATGSPNKVAKPDHIGKKDVKTPGKPAMQAPVTPSPNSHGFTTGRFALSPSTSPSHRTPTQGIAAKLASITRPRKTRSISKVQHSRILRRRGENQHRRKIEE